MASFISITFEFVPVAIITSLILISVLYIKYINTLTLKSAGSDICLGALFIQMTMLALPIWMSKEQSINVAGQLAAVLLTLIIWLITVGLLKRMRPSRTRSTRLYRKIVNYFIRQRDIRETLSYILSSFAFIISLMMVLNVISLDSWDWRVRSVQIVLAVLASVVIGYAGHSIYRYLQKEQFTRSFDRFSDEITRDNVLLTIQTSGSQKHDRDPVQPVVDIIRGSIMKNVLEPSLFGLGIVKNSCNEMLTTSGMRKENLNRVAIHFLNHVDNIGKLALRMDEDELAFKSIKVIGEIGETALSKGLYEPAEDIIRRLTEYYENAQRNEFEIMKMAVIDAVNQVGAKAAEFNNEQTVTRAVNLLGIIGVSSVRDGEKNTVDKVIKALFNIGRVSVDHLLGSCVKQNAIKLRDIGVLTIQIGLLDASLQIIGLLEEMGTAAASSKLELGTEQVIWSIKDMGVSFGYSRNETGLNAVVSAIASVGVQSSNNQLNEAVDQSLWSLKEVSRFPIIENLAASTVKSAESLARMAESEHDKVDQVMEDMRRYFSSDEATKLNKFEMEFDSARKKAGVH